MIPINPSTAFTRKANFVQEEWDVYFNDGGALPIDTINDGWRGVIMANLATVNPQESWKFFNRPDFPPEWLDTGASLAWYMAYAAGKLEVPSRQGSRDLHTFQVSVVRKRKVHPRTQQQRRRRLRLSSLASTRKELTARRQQTMKSMRRPPMGCETLS